MERIIIRKLKRSDFAEYYKNELSYYRELKKYCRHWVFGCKRVSGKGIGTMIVKELLERAKGKYEIDPTFGIGTYGERLTRRDKEIFLKTS